VRPQFARRWLFAVCTTVAIACLGAEGKPAAGADAPPALAERAIKLYNTHTHETLSVVFKRGEDFDSAALDMLKHILRDRRNGDSHDMDPRLFDQLHALAAAAGVPPDYEIISGYRSPASNAKMAAREGSGVAKKSLHMQGRAIDVRLRKCKTDRLRDLALEAKKGGVGYYARSDFVHIDTGTFRTWTGK
jgi:uncharacterized protein YcbK (DUF882 family)